MPNPLHSVLVACLTLHFAADVSAVEQVEVRRQGATIHLEGKLLQKARDGGLLLLEPDGILWAIQPEEIAARSDSARPFAPLTADQLGEQLLAELPAGFQVHRTANFVFCFDTSHAYAHWCGALFERLHRGYYNYWKNRDWELTPAELPLAAIIFQHRADFLRYARLELGEAAETVAGYYSLRTNRVVMYDLTATDSRLQSLRGGTQAAHIQALLAQPSASAGVATIIHEATHLLACNSGMHARYADIPLWVSEGLAMYFETPDLSSTRGWRTIGAVNRPRLLRLRSDLATRPSDSLAKLLGSDARFRNTHSAPAAYAEAWALNYFLLSKYPQQYQRYLRALARQQPLMYLTSEERLQMFRREMDIDLNELDAQFLQTMRSIR